MGHRAWRLACGPTGDRLDGLTFYGLAVAVNLASLGYALVNHHDLAVSAVEVGVTALLSLGFVYVAYEVPRTELSDAGPARILLGSLVLGSVGLVLAAVLIATQLTRGARIADQAHLAFLAWTWGAALGAPLGFYQERARFQNRRLLAAIDESRTLARQLSVNQRIMRHNLRNDLNVIMGFTDVLRDHVPPDGPAGAIDAIDGAAGRLHATCETFLEVQKLLEEDATPVEFDLAAVIDWVSEDCAIADQSVALELAVPDSSVVVAHRLLPEAIRELVAMAVLGVETSEASLAIRTAAADEATTRLVIEVADVEIAPPDCRALEGERESPLDHPDGVEAWFVRTVIERSEGTIEVCDAPPRGTRIRIDLPASPTCGRATGR